MMLGSSAPSLRALVLTTLAIRTWAQRDPAAVLAELDSLSDEELMRGTHAGGPAPYQACPAECSARDSPSKWTIYSEFERFSVCDQPMLFDFAIYNALDDPSTTTKFRLCTVDRFDKAPPGNTTTISLQQPRPGFLESTADLTLAQKGIAQQKGTAQRTLVPTLEVLRDGFQSDYNETLPTIMFSYHDDTIAAVYAGTAFDKGTIPSLISTMAEKLAGSAPAGTVMSQLCGGSRGTESTLGAIMSSASDLTLLQKVVKSWLDGTCATIPGSVSVTQLKVKTWESAGFNETLGRNVTRRSRIHAKRAKPQKNSDGSCYWVTVKKDDDCSKIGTPLGLTTDEIHKFNVGKTWGWKKCESLLPDLNICLSDGTPPVPFPIVDATCGPTVPGTVFSGTKPLKDYNPCPLNVCCNVWGNCGLNQDFCVSADGPSPGTSTLQNGCVSNCGNEIKTGAAPASYGRVGYYESWNYNRPCLHLPVKGANTDGTYTHIHWSFLEITDSWGVKISDPAKQWDDFKKLKEKKIVSFGGWGYSTEPATYDRIRQATNPANRAAFAANVVKFVVDNNLDGVDFDWEYPGAPDIDGIPAGLPEDGLNYLKFLTTMKQALAKSAPGKSLSIAAPASYWYLKAFPIARMADVLDYIVYMTYDLHGQWDAGSKWSVDACPEGNCIRSHVNKTETLLALSMITKAGVASNKIFVGESSYGRSFKLAQAGCTGSMCQFTGDRLHSNAAKGKCTDTAGYISDGEIKDIIAKGGKTWHDDVSDSDIVLYNGDEWVAHMNARTKKGRRDLWRGMNFAGTIDWAVDLQGDSGAGEGGEVVYIGPEVYSTGVAQCTPPCIMVFAPSSLSAPTAISPPPYTSSLEVGGGGGGVVVTRTITVTIQPVTVTEMPYENYWVSSSDVNFPIFITPSVDLPPQTVVVTGGDSKTTTRTVTVPPWPFLLSGAPERWTTTNSTDPAEETSSILAWLTVDRFDSEGADLPTREPEPPTITWPTGTIGPPGPTPTWPSGTIEPVLDDRKPPEGNKKRQSCRSWFFFVCISWGNIHIDFWDFEFPGPVTIGPGPPPPGLFKLPPGWTIIGTPKFPKIPIGPDGVPTPPPQPQGCTPTSQAELKIETEYFETSTSRGTVITTATKTATSKFPILGCEDAEATKSQDVCAAPTRLLAARSVEWPPARATPADEVELQQDHVVEVPRAMPAGAVLHEPHAVPAKAANLSSVHQNRRRAGDCEIVFDDLYVYPANPKDRAAVELIREVLDNARDLFGDLESYVEIKSDTLGFTAFFYVYNADVEAVQNSLVALSQAVVKGYSRSRHKINKPELAPERRRSEGTTPDSHDSTEDLVEGASHNDTGGLFERAMTGGVDTPSWALSILSVPPKANFLAGNKASPGPYAKRVNEIGPFNYYADPSSCQGTFIYIVDLGVEWANREFVGVDHEELPNQQFGAWDEWLEVGYYHGTEVASISSSRNIGVCKKTRTFSIARKSQVIGYKSLTPDDMITFAWKVADLLAVAENIAKNGRGSMSVVNMSWGMKYTGLWKELLKQVLQEISALGAVLVTTAGNEAPKQSYIYKYPASFVDEGIPEMIVVGAATMDSRRAPFSQIGSELTAYAPGHWLLSAQWKGGRKNTFGTSLAAPQVAGLVAYLRGLPGSAQQKARFAQPADVKRWIEKLSRPVQLGANSKNNLNGGVAAVQWKTDPPTEGQEVVSLVWNGQVGDHSCLLDDSVDECPKLDINDPTPVGGDPSCNAPVPGGSGSGARRRDQAAVNGSLDDDGSSNGGSMGLFDRAAACPIGPQGPTKTVSIRSGSPSPTCSGDHCGKLCRGFYCNLRTLSPGVHPPDFTQSPTTKKPDATTRAPTTTKNDPPAITLSGLPTLPSSSGWFPTSPSGGTCASSATLTSIGGPGGGGGQATLTSSGCVSWTTSSTKPADPTSVDPPKETEYPYTWYIYATVDDNFVTGQQKAEGYSTFDSPPSCDDVRNARTLADSNDVTGNGVHQIRCPGCTVCMTCGNDWSDWWNINVMELHTPSTWVTWYQERDNALVNTRDVKGGYCEIDTSHNFECWVALGMMWGSRQLKCHALFSQASIWK